MLNNAARLIKYAPCQVHVIAKKRLFNIQTNQVLNSNIFNRLVIFVEILVFKRIKAVLEIFFLFDEKSK